MILPVFEGAEIEGELEAAAALSAVGEFDAATVGIAKGDWRSEKLLGSLFALFGPAEGLMGCPWLRRPRRRGISDSLIALGGLDSLITV